MNDRYDIVYTGKLLPSFELETVIQKFSKLSKWDLQKSKKFIDRQSPVYFKRNLSKESAIEYKSVLINVGLDVKVKKNTSVSEAPAEATPKISLPKETLLRDVQNNKKNVPSYSFFEKLQDLFYEVELTRRLRITCSFLISLAITLAIFIYGSKNIKFYSTTIIGFSTFLVLFTIIFYLLSGYFKIESPAHKFRLFVILFAFMIFRIYKGIYINHDNLARVLIVTLIAWAAMIVTYRIFIYLKEPRF